MASHEYHAKQLEARCRICERKRDVGRSHRKVESLAFELVSVFGVDTRADSADCHPTKLCSGCWKFVQRSTSAGPSSLLPQTSIVPVAEWPECCGDSCSLCTQWKKEGKCGRPRKGLGPRGRLPAETDRKSSADSESIVSVDVESSSITLSVSNPIAVPEDHSLAVRLKPLAFQLSLLPERFMEEVQEDLLC